MGKDNKKLPDEPIYKEYPLPNGEILRVTKTEFDRVVNVFGRLLKQDEKMRREGRQLPSKVPTDAAPSSPPPTSHVAVPQGAAVVAPNTGGLPMAEMRDIGDRLTDFSAGIIKLLHQLPPSSVSRKIEDQMVRSAMSSGANYEEARGADSRADFCNKLQIALKEMRETRYWLCLTEKAGLIEGEAIKGLVQETTELRAILAKAVATARGKAKSHAEGRGSDSERAP